MCIVSGIIRPRKHYKSSPLTLSTYILLCSTFNRSLPVPADANPAAASSWWPSSSSSPCPSPRCTSDTTWPTSRTNSLASSSLYCFSSSSVCCCSSSASPSCFWRGAFGMAHRWGTATPDAVGRAEWGTSRLLCHPWPRLLLTMRRFFCRLRWPKVRRLVTTNSRSSYMVRVQGLAGGWGHNEEVFVLVCECVFVVEEMDVLMLWTLVSGMWKMFPWVETEFFGIKRWWVRCTESCRLFRDNCCGRHQHDMSLKGDLWFG